MLDFSLEHPRGGVTTLLEINKEGLGKAFVCGKADGLTTLAGFNQQFADTPMPSAVQSDNDIH